MPASVPVIIRPAEPVDLPDLCGLLKALFSLEKDFAFDPDRTRSGLADMLCNPTGCLLAAEARTASGPRVVGMCSGQLTVSTAEGGPAALVEDVVVAEDWRGQGVGRLLLAALEAWARDNKARRLQLLADRDNHPALDFYEHMGWTPTNLICLRRLCPQGA